MTSDVGRGIDVGRRTEMKIYPYNVMYGVVFHLEFDGDVQFCVHVAAPKSMFLSTFIVLSSSFQTFSYSGSLIIS